MNHSPSTLRTRVYVDGYNLYYGCLRKTPYKWLDLKALFARIIAQTVLQVEERPARFELHPLAIKFFTASILKNFAKEHDSVGCQQRYHNALRGHLGGSLEIISGYYLADPARAYRYEEGKPARECELLDIWKLEEKQSDVALALHAYADAIKGEVDHVVIVTNDTDVAPSLELIRAETAVSVGLIVPTRHSERPPNNALSRLAHWTRTHILAEELAASQLPNMVRLGTNPVQKPISWFPRPDLLEPVLREATRVKRSPNAALKWLNTPCRHLHGRIPIDMTADDESVVELWAYMKKYASDFNI